MRLFKKSRMPLVVYDSYLNKNTLITKSYRRVLVERIKYITKVVLINIYKQLQKTLVNDICHNSENIFLIRLIYAL